MELVENETLLKCESEELKDKYVSKNYEFDVEDEHITVTVFNKKDESDKENIIINSIHNASEKNDVSENKYNKITNKSKSIGVIMYLQDDEYKKENEENKNIHIRDSASPSILAMIIKKIFELLYDLEITELVMGHEHGKINNKCHLQIVLIFDKPFRKVLNPGALKIKYRNEYTCLLYMQQKTNNVYALKNYCKKDNDTTIVKDNELRKFESKLDGNPFQYIADNREKLTIEEGREKIIEYDPELYFRNSNNIENSLKKIITEIPKVPFMWMPLPEYLKTYYLSDGSSFYDTFSKWYNMYCINGDNYERKKAICLYSRERAMGKSYFVRHLVSDQQYILEFNNTICWKKNLNKGIYKLLLLDDMKMINENTYTMWKSLIASEYTTLRGAWCNEEYKERLPCIVTTNDIRMVAAFTLDKAFNTQITIIEIKKYMGAPGTERKDLMENDFVISYETIEEINKIKDKNFYKDNQNL